MSQVTPLLEAAEKRRAKLQSDLDELLATPTAEGRKVLNADEETRFNTITAELDDADKNIKAFSKQAKREAKATEALAKSDEGSEEKRAVGGAIITSEPKVYDQNNKRGGSYFQDLGVLAASSSRMGVEGADKALERMERNARQVEVEVREMKSKERREFSSFIESQGGSFEKRVNPNTTFGQGGEFVPPLWLVAQFAPYLRPARTFANRVTNRYLPGGIDVINLPKITLGSQTGVQAAQGGAVASRDITTTTISASVRTIAGQEDISLQLLEQSPLQMDGVIFDDLSRDYDLQLDSQIIYGTGTNGQHLGVLNVPGSTSNTSITNANFVTCSSAVFHDASTSGTQFRSILNAKNQIETLRIAAATGIWVSPRRANSWEYSAVDTQGRPLFVAYAPFNALGIDNPNIAEGVAGSLSGLPVVKDGNMPTTMNGTAVTGGTADPIVVLKEDDLILWEGTPKFRALPEILSGTLQVRYQMYCYSAFMPNRFAPSISIITGNTGLATPAW